MSDDHIVVDHNALAQDTLTNLLKECVLREGTDYGAVDVDFTAKVQQLHRSLQEGRAQIVYLPEHEYCDIVAIKN